eukprot:2079040-Amphidinium_carterae.2
MSCGQLELIEIVNRVHLDLLDSKEGCMTEVAWARVRCYWTKASDRQPMALIHVRFLVLLAHPGISKIVSSWGGAWNRS